MMKKWEVLAVCLLVFTAISCAIQKQTFVDSPTQKVIPRIEATYRWKNIEVPVYQGEVREPADTSYVRYDSLGRPMFHRVLLPYNRKGRSGWSCDETRYAYDDRDSLICRVCLAYTKVDSLALKRTTYYHRDVERRMDSVVISNADDAYSKKYFYKYDSLGRPVEKSLFQFDRLRVEKEWLYPSDSLIVCKTNNIFIDSMLVSKNKTTTIKRRIDGDAYTKEYGKAHIAVDSTAQGRSIRLTMNEARDTIQYFEMLIDSPTYTKSVFIHKRDTTYTEEYITLDRHGRWQYARTLRNGEQVVQDYRRTLYASDE